MKVILEQDVAKIGMRGDVVEVPNGYAMNQLIPKKMASAATGANLKNAEAKAAGKQAQAEADAKMFTVVAGQLKEASLVIKSDTNEEGGLFKAVSPEDIAAAAGEKSIDVDAAQVLVGEPIKSVGEHTVELVRGDARESFTITVEKNA